MEKVFLLGQCIVVKGSEILVREMLINVGLNLFYYIFFLGDTTASIAIEYVLNM